MKKAKILGIAVGVVLCIIIIKVIVPPSLLNYERLLEIFGFKKPEQEVVLEERNIELKGVLDPKKIVYETDNAIIRISYTVADAYFTQEIKHKKDINLDENAINKEMRYGKTVKDGEEFINWLESQKNEKEINISNSPYRDFLKNIGTDTLISIQLKKGEVEIYDKNNKNDVKFIKSKNIWYKSSIYFRYYLPDGTMFLNT